MEILIAIVLAVTGFYVGWNIGANDAANCIGTTVGARIISFRRAALLMAVFVILGGVLQGHHVMKTVGKGIVISSSASYIKIHNAPPPVEFSELFPDDKLPDLSIFVALTYNYGTRRAYPKVLHQHAFRQRLGRNEKKENTQPESLSFTVWH